MKTKLLIFLLVFLPFAMLALPENEVVKIKRFKGKNYEMLRGFPRTKIKRGKHGSVKLLPFSFDLGLGESTTYLLDFYQSRKKTIEIALSTNGGGGKVYMPLYALLDSNYKFIDIANPSDGGMVMQDLIQINPNIKYLLITSVPQFHGKKRLNNIRVSNREYVVLDNAILTDSSKVPPNSSTSVITDSSKLLKMIVPTKLSTRAYKKEHGVYFGFGINTGGERVAINSYGDDYKAGGGVQFHIGYTKPLFHSDFVGRVLIGTSYQGHKEDSACLKGTYMDYNLTFQTEYINVGGGFRHEFNSSIQNEQGVLFDFKGKLRPMALVEVRLSTLMNLNLHYIPGVFTTTNNENFKANRFGFSWNFNFGGVTF